MATTRFPFAFDRPFVLPLRALGVRPDTASVVVDDTQLRITFGPWRLATPIANVADVQVSHGYRWYRVIGPRVSVKDRGVTLGTSASGGVCLLLHRPVPLLLGERLPHPGISVTVQDPEALAAALTA